MVGFSGLRHGLYGTVFLFLYLFSLLVAQVSFQTFDSPSRKVVDVSKYLHNQIRCRFDNANVMSNTLVYILEQSKIHFVKFPRPLRRPLLQRRSR